LVIGGGDGTLNAAIDGWSTPAAFGHFVGNCQRPRSDSGYSEFLSEACAIIAKGQIQQIDLGWVNKALLQCWG